MRVRRTPLGVGVGGEHDLLDAAGPHALLELGDAQLVRPHSVDRGECPAQHVVAAPEPAALLDGGQVRRLLHDAQQGGIAPGVPADLAG
jgi:hypothetical protein